MLVDALRSASSAAPSALADLSSPLPPDAVDPHAVRSDGDGGSWAGQLERDPGAQLVAELVEAYPASLGDLDLVAALKAWERVGAWAAAQHADALRALLARADRFGGFDETAAILATEVRCTQRAAKDKLAWANTLGSFPAVNEALERGEIDVFRARAICDEAMLAPESSAQLVADLGLTLAPSKTPPQIRRALRAAVIGLDPAAAKERAAKVSADRRVEFHPMPDAMAMITAYLPAVDALAVKTALDALARTTAREDPRSFDQRRADYLGAIFHAICDAGEAPLHRDHVPGSAPAAPHDPASPRAAVDDVSDGPGDVYERHNDVSGGPDDVSDGPADTTNGASVASVASDCSDEPACEVVGHAPRTARATLLGLGLGLGLGLCTVASPLDAAAAAAAPPDHGERRYSPRTRRESRGSHRVRPGPGRRRTIARHRRHVARALYRQVGSRVSGRRAHVSPGRSPRASGRSSGPLVHVPGMRPPGIRLRPRPSNRLRPEPTGGRPDAPGKLARTVQVPPQPQDPPRVEPAPRPGVWCHVVALSAGHEPRSRT